MNLNKTAINTAYGQRGLKDSHKYLTENVKDILDGLLIYLCSKYDILKPSLNFKLHYNNAGYNSWGRKIIIGTKYINGNAFKIEVEPYLKIQTTSKFGEILFAFLHEFGHCIQHEKYPELYFKFKKEYREHEQFGSNCPSTHKRYRKLKLESTADNFAISFMRKHYPEHIIEKGDK